MTTFFIIVAALILDWLFGEPKRFHPLVGFGLLATRIENSLNQDNSSIRAQLLRGTLAVALLLLPLSLIGFYLSSLPIVGFTFTLIIVTLCIGHKSLHDHTQPIAEALNKGNELQARDLTSQIVSRDPETLDIAKASVESILENGSDSVFAALFWFVIAGVPGIIFYRLSNTLDAMWGYRNQQYLYFGRFAARLDDVLNYIPARLTALSYSILGSTKQALTCWFTQAKHCDSPNAGPVMAAGAGALEITIGGPAQYHGEWHQRPILGSGPPAEANDIHRALLLIRKTVLLWLVVLLVISGLTYA
ncbi:cobalamin biosynthesis protein [Methylophaga sp. 42_25_T18]|nr:cobalamin biosynthesis protein [Methylophaga sp. 42_25_T18]OUR88533.1 cobalamin biosynthesis protein [Methylophaga sp. 42_8_T64]